MNRTPWSATQGYSSRAAWIPTRASRTNSTNRVHTTSRARSIRAWSVRSSFSSLMKSSTKTSLVASASLAALAVAGGALFIGSGVYDIGADDHHTKLVLAVIERLRDHSIEARTRRLE